MDRPAGGSRAAPFRACPQLRPEERSSPTAGRSVSSSCRAHRTCKPFINCASRPCTSCVSLTSLPAFHTGSASLCGCSPARGEGGQTWGVESVSRPMPNLQRCHICARYCHVACKQHLTSAPCTSEHDLSPLELCRQLSPAAPARRSRLTVGNQRSGHAGPPPQGHLHS